MGKNSFNKNKCFSRATSLYNTHAHTHTHTHLFRSTESHPILYNPTGVEVSRLKLNARVSKKLEDKFMYWRSNSSIFCV